VVEPELGKRETLGWALLMLLPVVALVAHQWRYSPPASAGDYAQYLLHAQALASGRPYGDTGYIFTPLMWSTGPELLPPLWPAVLAPLVAVFGPLSQAPRLATLVSLIAFATLAGVFFGKREGKWVGVLVVGFLIVALEEAYGLTAPISDMLFGALFWATIWIGQEDKEWTWPRIAILVALAGLAIGTRVAGVVFVPAIVLAALLRSPAERRRGFLLGTVLFAAALVVILAIPERVPFLSRVTLDAEQLGRMLGTVMRYRVAFAGATLYPTAVAVINDAYHVAALLLLVVGLVTMLGRYLRGLLAPTLVCYGGMLLVAPVYDGRYLWPIFPVLVAAVATGLRHVLSRLPPLKAGAPRLATALLGTVLLAATLTASRREPPVSLAGQAEANDVFLWFRRNTDSSRTRVVFVNPRVFTLYTGVPAMPSFGGYGRDRMLAELDRRRITHFVLDLSDNTLQPSDFTAAIASIDPPWLTRYENARYRVLERPDTAVAAARARGGSQGP
jgi:hypothetical protein